MDVRSNRVRTLLGLNSEEQDEEQHFRSYDKQQQQQQRNRQYSGGAINSIRKYEYGSFLLDSIY